MLCRSRADQLARSAVCWAGASILVGLLATMVPSAVAAATTNLLVLFSNGRLTPANDAMEGGLREAIPFSEARPVAWFDEFLDEPRFGGPAHTQAMVAYLRAKYAARPPDVIVAAGNEALAFLLRHRAELFTRVPVIHLAVDRASLGSMPPLPADVVGLAMEFPFSATIGQALRWHPRAKRLVIVTGTSVRDREWEYRLRAEVAQFRDRVTIEFLAGLPTAEVLKRLGQLGGDAVVFTPGYFRDGAGLGLAPREAVGMMAAVATAPMYGPFDTFMGTGVVGGYMLEFKTMGRQAGRIVDGLLAGAAPESLQLPQLAPTHLQVDWRQVRRWGIPPRAIPASAVLHFKAPTLWEANRKDVLIIAALFGLQSVLVGWLMVEYRRRHRAELVNEVHRSELAHASRLTIAGELIASITHEINQPLGALVSNADAAEMILESGTHRPGDLRLILADIRSDSLRASEVIRRLRALLARQEVERRPFDLNETVHEVEAMLRSEANRRQVTLHTKSATDPVALVGDRIQIQQVLINLVLNAMDEVRGLPENRRTIVVSVERVARGALIAVRDRGKGIAANAMPKIFDSFFSTKHDGMGMGLSIARTIVTAHGGRIWAENGLSEGVVFHVELPVTVEAGAPSSRRA